MKTRLFFRITLIVTLLISLLGVSSFASKTESINDLFGQLNSVDGFSAENLSITLYDKFNSDETQFVERASELSEENQLKLASLLVYAAEYDNLDKFKSRVLNLIENSQNTYNEVTFFEKILKNIDKVSSSELASITSSEDVSNKVLNFNPKQLLKLINKIGDNEDEELSESITLLFKKDPKLFMDTISEVTNIEKNNLLKSMASSNLIDENQVNNIMNENPELSGVEQEFINNILSELRTHNNVPRNDINSINKYKKSLIVPIVDFISLDNSTPEIGIETNLNLSVVEMTGMQTDRNYILEVCILKNNKEYTKRYENIKMSKGVTNLSLSVPITFYSSESSTIKVKVLDNQYNELMKEYSLASVSAVGKWHIDVCLPTNRSYKGHLYLFDGTGNSLLYIECLGKSESNASMYQSFGNTPTGEYTGYLYGPASPSSSYGPYKVVNMTGVSGAIVASGRSDIWIHGGNPITDTTNSHYPLRVTYGCVRITNSDQSTLQNIISNLVSNGHSSVGTISITEY